MAFLGECLSLTCFTLCTVLIQAGFMSPCLMKNLLPWLDFSSHRLRVTAAAFFDQVKLKAVKRRDHRAFIEILLLVRSGFLWEDLWKMVLWSGVAMGAPGWDHVPAMLPVLFQIPQDCRTVGTAD